MGARSLADYTHIVGRPLVEEIRLLAESLQGKRVLHLSATAFGGGVSEILYTLVPLMRDVGIDAHWQVIRFMRAEDFAKGTGPTVRVLGKASGVSIKELYKLFPKGPAKIAAKIAGIPKPRGCI